MPGQIVIQFSTSTAWQSKLIRKLCHGPFSHVDMVLDDGNLLGASDQGPGSPCIAGNPQGVAIRPPNYQEFGIRRNLILRTDKAKEIEAAWLSQVGKPFDDGALHGFLNDAPFDRNWRQRDKWFCTELCVWGLETGGYWMPDELIWAKNRFSPLDVLGLFQWDRNWVNKQTFWDPITGLERSKGEL